MQATKDDTHMELYMTHTLRGVMSSYKKTMSAHEYNLLSTEIIMRIQAYQAQFSKVSGPARAVAIHKLMDAIIEDNRKGEHWKKVSCKSGCNACCHMRVEITREEAELLKSLPIEIDKERLAKQAKVKELMKIPREHAKCVYLSKAGRCKVYEHRPMTCRKHFVRSDPASCLPTPSGKTQGVTILAINEAELITSAALDMSGNDCGSIAEMML